MSDPQLPKIIYEPPDNDRPASAAPTEPELEREAPSIARLDYAPAAPPHDPYAALRVSSYRFFAAGFFISVIASQMQAVSARYEIFQKTGSVMNLGWVGLVLAAPMLLLTLPAGQLADRRSRRKLMIATQLVGASCTLGLAWVSYFRPQWQHSVSAMYVLLGLGAAGTTLGRPARESLLPQLVPGPTFANAMMWISTMFESASVIGPAIGGFVCGRSIPLAYVLSAGCFLGCTVFMLLIPEPPPAARGTQQRPGFSDVAVGLKFVWRSKLMLALMTLDLFAVLLGGVTFLLPAFAKDILHVGATGFGWLSAAMSIGAILMALLQAHRPPMKHAGRAMLLAVCGFGVVTIVFGLSRNFWLSFFMLVLAGAFDNISVVVRHTVIQMLTPNPMRGRVSAVNQIFIGSSNELGGMESGLTAAWLGPIISVVGGGIGTLLVVCGVACIWPEVRRLGSLKDLDGIADATPNANESAGATAT